MRQISDLETVIDLEEANKHLRQMSPVERIRWAYDVAGDRLVTSTSGGLTSRTLPSLIKDALPEVNIPIFFVNTGFYGITTVKQIRGMLKMQLFFS